MHVLRSDRAYRTAVVLPVCPCMCMYVIVCVCVCVRLNTGVRSVVSIPRAHHPPLAASTLSQPSVHSEYSPRFHCTNKTPRISLCIAIMALMQQRAGRVDTSLALAVVARAYVQVSQDRVVSVCVSLCVCQVLGGGRPYRRAGCAHRQ